MGSNDAGADRLAEPTVNSPGWDRFADWEAWPARFLLAVLATLLVLAALALFGGEMIFGFAVALLVGVAVGTYSSMYVAATTLLQLGVSKEDVMVPEREGADQEGLMP